MQQPLLAVEAAPPRRTSPCRRAVVASVAAALLLAAGVCLRAYATPGPSPVRTVGLLGLRACGGGDTCFQETGGTCFITDCDPVRGSSCKVTFGWRFFGWHACVCDDNLCSHPSGKCSDRHSEQSWIIQYMRGEHLWVLVAVVIPLLRSQALGPLLDFFGCTAMSLRATTSVERPTTTFDFWKSLKELQADLQLKEYRLRDLMGDVMGDILGDVIIRPQMAGIYFTKFGIVHCGQIVFVLTGFMAYHMYMGWLQWLFATVVVLKETWYGILLLWATCDSDASRYLLFAPMSETSNQLVLAYVCDPEYFIARCIEPPESTSQGDTSEGEDTTKVDLMAPSGPLTRITRYVSVAGGAAAVLAILSGLIGDGAMFMSLLASYVVSSLSLVVLILNRWAPSVARRKENELLTALCVATAQAKNADAEIRCVACKALADCAKKNATNTQAKDIEEWLVALAKDREPAVSKAAVNEIKQICSKPSDRRQAVLSELLALSTIVGVKKHVSDHSRTALTELAINSSKGIQECGLDARKLNNAGVAAKDLKQGGFSAQQMKDAGVSLEALKDAGFSAEDLLRVHFYLADLKDVGFSAKELKDASFSAKDLKNVGFTYKKLKDGGFLAKDLKDAGYSPLKYVPGPWGGYYENVGGLSLEDHKDAGFSLTEMKGFGYSAKQLKDVGFSLQELASVGFFLDELKGAGFSLTELKGVGFSIEQMKRCGYDVGWFAETRDLFGAWHE